MQTADFKNLNRNPIVGEGCLKLLSDHRAGGTILRCISVHNSCVTAAVRVNQSQRQRGSKRVRGRGTFSPFPTIATRKSERRFTTDWRKNTHSCRVNPTDLRLEFRKAHKQHDVVFPGETCFPRPATRDLARCLRDISNYMA